MTLTTRLSLFFLTMLGIVLVGFSATLYLLARVYLYQQIEERLNAAMNILVAAVEVGPEGVEWEPEERQLILGHGALRDQVVWLVTDDKGRVVDGSGQPSDEGLFTEGSDNWRDAQQAGIKVDRQGGRWQLSHRWIQSAKGNQSQPRPSQPGQANEPAKYPALAIMAGVSLEPVRATLRQLAAVLISLSLGIWFVALFLGRAVSRRALRPVIRMASSARLMDAADLGQRLPVTSSGDELQDLAGAFNGLLERLQESFERQRRFTGDASHQLRNPLAAMLGQIEVALRRPRPLQEYERVLNSAQGQALHMRQIVEALLFLARGNAEVQLLHLERIDLTSWLTEHIRHWSDHPRATDLRVDSPPDVPIWVKAQEPLLSQLVDILLENAIKYSESGSSIALRTWTEEATACLAVEDKGRGIDQEDLSHIFEPFFRSPAAQRNGVDGVGLGLALAERIAAALRGRIIVASERGRGSCFTLRLPSAALFDPVLAQCLDGSSRPPQDAGLGCRK